MTLGFIVPEAIGFSSAIPNPALPPRRAARLPPRLRPVSKSITSTNGIGPRRVYLDFQSTESEKSHPLRPVTGSVADLDVIMKNCDFSTNQVTAASPLSSHERLVSVFRVLGWLTCSFSRVSTCGTVWKCFGWVRDWIMGRG